MIKRKLSPEEKITAVGSYLNGAWQFHTIVEQYRIAKESFRTWVRNYQIFGRAGLRDKHGQASYSGEVQTAAVKDYLSEAGSQTDICKKYKIYSRTQLQNWIKLSNSHRELRPNRGRGSDIYMTKGRNTTYEERVEIVSYCIEHGTDYTATIEKYGVSYQYQQIYSWVRKYNEKGAEGLVDKRGKRKPESEMTETRTGEVESRMLEARNKRLELECTVLKKLEEIEGRWR